MVKLIRGTKIIQRNDQDWEKNQKVYEMRGFKLYSEEKKSTPKKKRGKDV